MHGDHVGDLPSLLVNHDGTGELAFETDRFSLDDLFDHDGSALIVHAGRDNFANIPSRTRRTPSDRIPRRAPPVTPAPARRAEQCSGAAGGRSMSLCSASRGVG
jgi:Cu/Zn superoxide dismutase